MLTCKNCSSNKIALKNVMKFYTFPSIRAMEKVALKSKSRRGSRGSYENFSVRLTKKFDTNSFNNYNNMLSFIDFEASFVMSFNNKVSKNAPKHEIV